MAINDLLANPALYIDKLSLSNFAIANVVLLAIALLVLIAHIVVLVYYKYKQPPHF